MDTVWTHIRLRKGTVDRLRREAAYLIGLYVQGRYELPRAGEGLSMDWLINNLLDNREGHRRRARAQTARRKARGQPRPGPPDASGAKSVNISPAGCRLSPVSAGTEAGPF